MADQQSAKRTSVKISSKLCSRLLLGAAAALIVAAMVAPGAAQAPDAAERCTGDVMSLCSEFIPDRDKITACLKKKRSQLGPDCKQVMTPKGKKKGKRRRA